MTPADLTHEALRAISASDGEKIRELARLGWNPNETEYPLRLAAIDGRPEIVALLLDLGADPKAAECSALRRAAGAISTIMAVDPETQEEKMRDCIRILLDRGADIHAGGDEALRNCAEFGYGQTAALLLERGADPNAGDNSALKAALEGWRTCRENGWRSGKHEETLSLLLEAGGQEQKDPSLALLAHTATGNYEKARNLLEKGGADPCYERSKALEFAAWAGDEKMVGLLLQAGADPAARESYFVEIAAIVRSKKTLEALLEAGCPPRVQGDDHTTLLESSAGELRELGKMILKKYTK